ncbi:MAG: DUF3141 domain-containing protein [Deltaproteobacteria bacterium]|nr:DUF3141 domain-containing protein [Deltaproteobacteria bacterium]
MEKEFKLSNFLPDTGILKEAYEYLYDAAQRSVLYSDIMRKRGNTYLEHIKAGQPPVLTFDYKIIMDGRDLERPTNYKLAEILPPKGVTIDPDLRPVIIIDPRAGHGPGIGGSKRESEIGMAMNAGHPVYFILFEPDPVPGQTIPDVEKAEIAFIDEVIRRHPNSRKPSVTGNCQAGWALAMLSADRPGTTGPIVFNGSPLSYWAGIEGKDVMRYLGGLLGGVWVNSLMGDLSNGIFDGANLVKNFENMNITNTLWTKKYNLWSKVDTEEKRFLDFEKWWGGFFNMTKDEIHFIVNNLFVGNKLEKGGVRLNEDKYLDLKDIQDPVVVFCSNGDAITPPLQALNWIVQTWGTLEEIKQCQQVIVYMLHENIGHLGIFVSGKVARKEHKQIISSYDMIEYLPPGLYEMVIEDGDPIKSPEKDLLVRFEAREIEDILALDDGMTSEDEQFPLVAAVSDRNDELYHTYVSPLVKMFSNEFTAEVLKQTHSLRIARYGLSDLNPFIFPVTMWAPHVKENRRPVSSDNLFVHMEKSASNLIETTLNNVSSFQAFMSETIFHSVYDQTSWLNWFYPEARPKNQTPQEMIVERRERKKREKADHDHWMAAMDKGGFVEGLIRIIVAISSADRILDREEFLKIQQISKTHERLKDIEISEFRRIAKDQARIFQTDTDRAIATLADLLPTEKDRKDIFEICAIVFEDNPLSDETLAMMKRLAQGKSQLDSVGKKRTQPKSTVRKRAAKPKKAAAKATAKKAGKVKSKPKKKNGN